MPASRSIQAVFNEVNAVSPAHILGDDQLQSGSNVDFGLGQGAIFPRRGVRAEGSISGSSVNFLFRHYRDDSTTNSPFYALDSAGTVFRGSGTSWTAIMTGGSSKDRCGMSIFGSYALIADGTQYIKDDGTLTTEWIKQVPTTPTVTVATLSPISYSTGSFGVLEGTLIGGSSTCTAVTNSNNRITFSMTLNGTSGVDLTVNGTETIGPFGVHFVDLAFDNPSNITRISQDWSVGDATFYTYWHNDLFPQNALVPFVDGQPVNASAQANPNDLIDSQLNSGTGTDTTPISQIEREQMLAAIRSNNLTAASVITRLQNTFAPWAVARPDLTYVGTASGTSGDDPWKSTFKVRYTIECNAATTATIRTPEIRGGANYPLTDVVVGYSWWQTYAACDADGNVVGESGPSPASARTTMQNSKAVIVQTGTATGTIHGITHLITYRQGGYTRDAYAVSQVPYGTFTITDTMNDIQALADNFVLDRSILSVGEMPAACECMVSEPFQDRVFLATGGEGIRWSLPGKFDSFPVDSFAKISHPGDPVVQMVAWSPGLVIVNRHSVYEMTGNDFEDGGFILTRSGSRHGAMAARVAIKTPFGIPLLSNDGLTMYLPGQGVDQEIPWLDHKYGDAFKGDNSFDPAAIKGNRIPALDRGSIVNASAAYAQQKLYIAAVTGTDTLAQTLFVLDFAAQKAWWHHYSFGIKNLLWDVQDDRLYATGADGKLIRMEYAQGDGLTVGTGGTLSGIPWSAKTKKWSAVNDSLLEHCYVETEIPNGNVIVKAIYDATATVTQTLTGSNRQWQYMPLNGSFANSVEFEFSGTNNSFTPYVYQMNFDIMSEPPRTLYWRSDYDEHQWTNDKLWDVAYFDIAMRGINSGTLTAVTFVDNTAVMTNTFVAPVSGRSVFMTSFPAETYGRVAYTTYTSASLFQHWETRYEARNEPPKINYYRSDITSLDENICDAWDCDINPNGTVTSTCFVDNVAVSTQTLTGTNRQSYTLTLPNEEYGRTIYTVYNGSQFKLYNNWFHLRPEPDRWTNFVTPKISGEEHEWKVFTPEVNCLGHTVLATSFVEGTAVATHTITGTSRQQYTFSMPIRTFGRTIWTVYNASSGTFKRYPASTPALEYEGVPEPSRVTTWRTGPTPFPSSHYLKTWLPHLDPINNTVVGTLIVDDAVLSTATFTGDRQQWFTVGLDINASNAIQTGSRWEAVYSVASGKFKHYETKLESESKPFGKSTWSYGYRKVGGASQLDMPRFWSIEAESLGTATCTYFWDIDSAQFTTGTITLTGGGPQWIDRISLPPGGRGRIFEFRLQAGANNIKVSKVNLDLGQEGIKNLVRREQAGQPDQQDGI